MDFLIFIILGIVFVVLCKLSEKKVSFIVSLKDVHYIEIKNLYTQKSYICYDKIKIKALLKKTSSLKYKRKIINNVQHLNGFEVTFCDFKDNIIKTFIYKEPNIVFNDGKLFKSTVNIDFSFLEKLFFDISQQELYSKR